MGWELQRVREAPCILAMDCNTEPVDFIVGTRSVEDLVSTSPSKAPFTFAFARAECLCVVRNEEEDIY